MSLTQKSGKEGRFVKVSPVRGHNDVYVLVVAERMKLTHHPEKK